MQVLITGGAGFIGSNLAEFHLAKGDNVFVVDDLSMGTMDNLQAFKNNPLFKFEKADILTWDALGDAVQSADRIYHMAAMVGMFQVLKKHVELLEMNVLTYARLLRIAALSNSNAQIMVPSSSSVYGANKKQPHSETDLLLIKSVIDSRWAYAISKITVEALSQAYVQDRKLKITIARLFNHIGPRQTGYYGMVVPRFINQAINGEPITVYGNGEQTRSFLDVRDSVAIIDKLINNEKAINDIVNVGSTEEISIKDLALLIKKLAGSESSIKYLSYMEAYGQEMDETFRRKPCLDKLSTYVKYERQWTLEKTLLDLIERARQARGK